jgi:hypothetical protein
MREQGSRAVDAAHSRASVCHQRTEPAVPTAKIEDLEAAKIVA